MTGSASAQEPAADTGGKGFLTQVLTARGFAVVWLGYVLANALIRYSLSHTLSTDDAPESLLVQALRLGYDPRHPPLWEWLLWTVQQLAGPGPASHFILRYGCIFLLGVAVFRASRAVCGSVPWSAAVALSTPLVYQLGWPFFEWGTHTLALAVVSLFALEAAIRHASRPTYATAAVLGALVGLGFLAKWGFALIMLALALALVVRRETRAALFRRETLLVPVVALIVVSPFLYWLVETGTNVVSMTQETLVRSSASHFERVLEGFKAFLGKGLQFVTPWPIVLAVAVLEGRRRDKNRMSPAGTGERIAGLTLLFSVAITVAAILAFGITNMTSGYIVPVLIALLPASAGLLARAAPGEIGPGRLATLAVVTLVAITLVRLAYLSNGGYPERSHRREMLPYAGLAEEIRKAGLDRGTLVTVNDRDGGNLQAQLPGLRVVMINQSDLRPPARADSPSACRLLWNDSEAINPGLRWARSSDSERATALPQVAGRERRHFDIAWAPTYLGTPRVSRWTIVELDADDPLCR